MVRFGKENDAQAGRLVPRLKAAISWRPLCVRPGQQGFPCRVPAFVGIGCSPLFVCGELPNGPRNATLFKAVRYGDKAKIAAREHLEDRPDDRRLLFVDDERRR